MLDFGTSILNEGEDNLPENKENNYSAGVFQPFNLNNTFIVNHSYQEADQKNTKNLDYKVHIKTLEERDSGFVIAYQKSDFYINRKQPSLLIESLVDQIYNGISPFELLYDYNGKFIGLLNIETIRKRWEILKLQLTKEYQGDLFSDILNNFEKKTQDAIAFEMDFKQDNFLNLYFNGIDFFQQKDGASSSMEYKISSDSPNKVLRGKILRPIQNNNELYEIEFNGKSNVELYIEPKSQKIFDNVQILNRVTYIKDIESTNFTYIKSSLDIYSRSSNLLKGLDLKICLMDGKKANFIFPEIQEQNSTKEEGSTKRKKGFFNIFKR